MDKTQVLKIQRSLRNVITKSGRMLSSRMESPVYRKVDAGFGPAVGGSTAGKPVASSPTDWHVAAFQHQDDAERFYQELSQRLAKFGLELSADKTRVVPFSQHHDLGKTSFDFLGFEFRWGKDRTGTPRVKRRTSRKKLRNSLQQFTEWCKIKCRDGLKDLFRGLNAKLRGYYNYYGVNGNYASLQQFFDQAIRILFKWLNRRSQRRSYNWTGFRELLRDFQIERPHIVGRPKARRALGSACA